MRFATLQLDCFKPESLWLRLEKYTTRNLGHNSRFALDHHSDRIVSFFLNNNQAQAELRCTNAEETDSAPPKTSDFGQEKDHLLLH
jgi:hypothetical protein